MGHILLPVCACVATITAHCEIPAAAGRDGQSAGQAALKTVDRTLACPALGPCSLGPCGLQEPVDSHTALGSCLFDASNHEQDGDQEGHTALCDSKCVALCNVYLVNLLCSQSVFPHV